jgi:HD-GYP domain-containing protein (c-di-GMP phosphodiesterase class II)
MPIVLMPGKAAQVPMWDDNDRKALAEAVRSQSYGIAAALLRRAVRGPEINVGLELTALSFADRFADSIASGDWSTLYAWVDGVCERYAELPVIARLLRAGPATIQSVVRELGGGFATPPAELAALAHEFERIAARPRASASLRATDALDEIDVVLGELVNRLEAADPLTAEHSRAVGVWCSRIAKRMSLSRSETVFVSRCGLIHDIGKLTTPPAILSAPRRLTVTEMNVMRRHAEDGAAIIKAIPLLAHHTPAVRGHHERLDGRGYPDGAVAAQIPLAARIVAVADSFNAMIGNRPYRLPMRPTAALEELRLHTGSQFDPDIIDAMHDVLRRAPGEAHPTPR